MTRILIADTETTGLIEPIEPIELAYLEIEYPSLKVTNEFEMQYKPSKPIEYGAMAISHILEEDLFDKLDSSYAKIAIGTPDYLIGHNIDYDWKVLGSPKTKRIDTMWIARYLYPTLGSHTQSAMLYYFMGAAARPLLKEAHNALCDVKNCHRLLGYLIDVIKDSKGDFSNSDHNIDTIEDLYTLSEEARIPRVMSFGKFKGQPYTALDYGYVDWWRTKSDTKPNEYELIALRKAGFRV